MLQIFLVGLTGGVGGLFAARALEHDHDVVALVRDPARVKVAPSPKLRTVTGDLTSMSAEALAAAVSGCDVVVTAFGMSRTGGAVTPHVQEDGVRALLAAMTTAGVKRIVYLGAGHERDAWAVHALRARRPGAASTRVRCAPHGDVNLPRAPPHAGSCFIAQPGDKWGWLDSAAYAVASSTFLRAVAADAVKAFALLEAAPDAVAWTYLRAPFLGDGPLTGGPLRLGDANVGAGSPASTLSRADAARALLDFAVMPELFAAWSRKAPVVTAAWDHKQRPEAHTGK